MNVRRILLATVFFLLLLPRGVWAKPMDVMAVGFDKGGNEAVAVERMCMAATGHSLAFIIPPSQDPSSDFVRLIKAHYKEVTSNPQIKQRKNGPPLVVTGFVTVDFDRLKAIVRTEIKGIQNENTDAATCFLIRVQGIDNPQQLRHAYGDIIQTYSAVFENLGFRVKAGEEVTPEVLKNPPGESFEDFCRRVSEAAKEDVEITYAIVGEISVEKLAESPAGITWGSSAHLQARDFTSADGEKIIFDFGDDYKLKGRGELAGFFAMRKAAMNSSRALAEHTLAYWKSAH
ncbi:hypothetical protein [Selenomonas ruminantium]|uniref:Lipoprotein n=1 Tax=Selenomonas ruminantium TaxID=971 RepID=A0A1K1NKG3_SELRU|nr:hypothetical protein [Selenomonas ruminantium]SFW35753.1 hypothetical protein SAMN02910323_1435 [Selenomonas ruminantium]